MNEDAHTQPEVKPMAATPITDKIIGAYLASKNIAPLETLDAQTKAEIRNRIVFWMSVVGGVVQVANFLYTYLMK